MKNELYDIYDMRVARILWFLIGFCSGSLLIFLIK
ncbi:hypothetical protein EV143_12022 [Flavobacterium chryseum]|nr:hypothetical protein EV143_12022 [Flavobacterium sp. P3160]